MRRSLTRTLVVLACAFLLVALAAASASAVGAAQAAEGSRVGEVVVGVVVAVVLLASFVLPGYLETQAAGSAAGPATRARPGAVRLSPAA
ncbi:MAG: hypothetical protein WKF83_04395 [Nocardioidaceae bacterium]